MIFPHNKQINYYNLSLEIINSHFKTYTINLKKYQKNLEERKKLIKCQGKIEKNLPIDLNFSNPNYYYTSGEFSQIKEDVINWFFSLSLEERMKISTIENNIIVEIFYQMNYYFKLDRNVCFELKNYNEFYDQNSVVKKSERENFMNSSIVYKTNSFAESSIDNLTDRKTNENPLLNYFTYKSIENEYDENFLFYKSLLLENLLIFSVHIDLDSISLSPKILDNKKEFLKYFNYFSWEKSFTELIELNNNKNKNNFFNLPKWIASDHHPNVAFVLGFFEQIIMIKFILNYGKNLTNFNFDNLIKFNSHRVFCCEKNLNFDLCECVNYPKKNSLDNLNDNSKSDKNISNLSHNKDEIDDFPNHCTNPNLIFSLINENKLNEFFELRKDIIYFLYENFPTKEYLSDFNLDYNDPDQVKFLENELLNRKTPEDLFKKIDIPFLLDNICKNKKITDLILLKNRPLEIGFKSFIGNYIKQSSKIDLMNIKLFLIGKDENETQKNFLKKYKDDTILFLDFLIFYNIELLWKKEYFLYREIYEKLCNLYQEKNALDLINEVENDNLLKKSNNKKNNNNNRNLTVNKKNCKVSNNSNNKILNKNNKKISENLQNNKINLYNKINVIYTSNINSVNSNFFIENKKENFNYFKSYLNNNKFFKTSELNDPFLIHKSELSNYYKDNIMNKSLNNTQIKNSINSNKKNKSKSKSKEEKKKRSDDNNDHVINGILTNIINEVVEFSDNFNKMNEKRDLRSIKQKFLDSLEEKNENNKNINYKNNNNMNEENECYENSMEKRINTYKLEENTNSDNGFGCDFRKNSIEDLINHDVQSEFNIKKLKKNLNQNNEIIKQNVIKNYFANTEDLLIAKGKNYTDLIKLDSDDLFETKKNKKFSQEKKISCVNKHSKNNNVIKNNNDINNYNINSKEAIYGNISKNEDEYFEINSIKNESPKSSDKILNKHNDDEAIIHKIDNNNNKEDSTNPSTKANNSNLDKEYNNMLSSSFSSEKSPKNKKKNKKKQQTFFKISTKKNLIKKITSSNDLFEEKFKEEFSDKISNYHEVNKIYSDSFNIITNKNILGISNNSENSSNLYNYRIDDDFKSNDQTFKPNFPEGIKNKALITGKVNNQREKIIAEELTYKTNNKINKQENKYNNQNNNQLNAYKQNKNLKNNNQNSHLINDNINNQNPKIINNNIYYSNSNQKNNNKKGDYFDSNINDNQNVNNKHSGFKTEKQKSFNINNSNSFNITTNNGSNSKGNTFKNNSFNYREQNVSNNKYYIPNFNKNLHITNGKQFPEHFSNNPSKNSSILSSNSFNFNKSLSDLNSNNSPNVKHKKSFNCQENTLNFFEKEYNFNNVNYPNNQINITNNNINNYFTFNIDSGNQYLKELDKIPRKRSHNITSDAPNLMLDHVVNQNNLNQNISMPPFNNFMNSNNMYGQIMDNMNIVGIPGRYDMMNFPNYPGMNPFSINGGNFLNFNIHNFINTNSMPQSNFPFGTNILQMMNSNNMIGNKINMNNQEFYSTFTCKLHNDILDYLNDVNSIVDLLKAIKLNVVSYIEKMIKLFMEYEITLDIFGSFASDLSIESSDIDLKVNILSEESDSIDYETIIFNLVKFFNEKNVFENVIPIHTASIPIIKLVIDPKKVICDDNLLIFEEFRYSEKYENFKFNKEELNKFKIDLTFLDLIKKQQNSLESINFAKKNIILFPEIKPILFILKRFLLEKNLNSAFNGGLSSYCIFLLILSYIKYKNTLIKNNNGKLEYNTISNNLGKLIMDFLVCYGKLFDFHFSSIDVNQANPFIFTNQSFDNCPIILDPINYHNASKTSFRIDEVKETFGKLYDYLTFRMSNMGKDINAYNIIYDMILQNQ